MWRSQCFPLILKCHISRDYGPVLWAGSSLVFIIKCPSNRSSSSCSSPSSGWPSGLCVSVPSRELPQSVRGCGAPAKKTGVPHSSVSSIPSELGLNLLTCVDNPLGFLRPGRLNPESVYANLPPLSSSLLWPVTRLFIWIILFKVLDFTGFRMTAHSYVQSPQLTYSCKRPQWMAAPSLWIPVLMPGLGLAVLLRAKDSGVINSAK